MTIVVEAEADIEGAVFSTTEKLLSSVEHATTKRIGNNKADSRDHIHLSTKANLADPLLASDNERARNSCDRTTS